MIKASWPLILSFWNLKNHRNVIMCSMAHYQHFLKVSFKSLNTFFELFLKDTDRLSYNNLCPQVNLPLHGTQSLTWSIYTSIVSSHATLAKIVCIKRSWLLGQSYVYLLSLPLVWHVHDQRRHVPIFRKVKGNGCTVLKTRTYQDFTWNERDRKSFQNIPSPLKTNYMLNC